MSYRALSQISLGTFGIPERERKLGVMVHHEICTTVETKKKREEIKKMSRHSLYRQICKGGAWREEEESDSIILKRCESQ